MMAKYIDAAVLNSELQKICQKYSISFGGESTGFGSKIAKIAENLPAADVQEVKRGKWIFGEFDEFMGYSARCSECGDRTSRIAVPAEWIAYHKHKYCGNCGAKMDGKDGDNNG